ncbi:hypothetical protein F5Y16DRAFT_362844 [Xylariaceae sp. FL0255]|nr:hypothetical protein F5Y16DRAFT_362844 [Xylariaceae sp. FL0255]
MEDDHVSNSFEECTHLQCVYRDYGLEDILPVFTMPEHEDKHSSFCRFGFGYDLGTLGILPVELVYTILSYDLDVHSLMDFRSVNRCAFEIVGNIPRFRAIIQYARNALYGILYTNIKRDITYQTLYDKLCTEKCEDCDDFGGYLHLLTCKRVCFLCATDAPENGLLELGRFRLNEDSFVANHPCMRVVPGKYSPTQQRVEQIILVNYESGHAAATEAHGADWDRENMLIRWETKTYLPLTAIVRVPYWSPDTKQQESGRYCNGCRGRWLPRERRPYHFRRIFSEASFGKHLEECGEIVRREDSIVSWFHIVT